MKNLLNGLKNLKGERKLSDAWRKKSMLCSTEAAAVSIAIHVALLLFAGSIVAIRYVQKQDAAFSGENVSRPRLERRQLQMPVKVRKLQQKSSRPKVTTRMASVSSGSFSLPDMSGLGGAGPMGFDRAGGAGGDRELSSLGAAGSLGFGVSTINFFGARSKGEKPIFLVQADQRILQDEKGGYFTYQFVKDRIYRMVDSMSSATLFNVIIFSDTHTQMFRTEPVAATPDNKKALKEWFATVNSSPDRAGKISDIGIPYDEPIRYEDSLVGDEAIGWVRAAQAAMEQRADAIFVLAGGWGEHIISQENRAKMFGIDESEEEWLRRQGWPPDRIEKWKEKVAALDERAHEILEEENEARARKGLPPKIIHPSAFWRYRTEDLGLRDPPGPPHMTTALGGRVFYNAEEISEHLEVVVDYNYRPYKLDDPELHIVNLIAADANPSDDGDGISYMREVAQNFRGGLEFLRGAESMENLVKLNRGLDDE